MMEDTHANCYSLFIETYIKDTTEKNELYNAMSNMPCLKKKADWMIEHINDNMSFAERLFAFSIVEGIFFQGAFASIYYLRKRGIMPGLC